MILNKTAYSYQDLTIIPETITDINSRSECYPFVSDLTVNHNGMLPIFASPMSTITNDKNIDIWKNNHIMPIIPRNINIVYRELKLEEGEWVALSLNEFKDLFINVEITEECKTGIPSYMIGKNFRVCVDLANGHMNSLYETINKAKQLSRKYGYTLEIMTGNIANPKTYEWICEHAEVDYIRLSIGTGNNCITSTQTSIHYPIATLIDECYQIKKDVFFENGKWKKFFGYNEDEYIDEEDYDPYIYYKSCPKIVADGGIRGYADVIKALALGADYVMIGSLFTGLLESAAPLNIECYNSHYKYMFNSQTGQICDGINWLWSIWDKNENVDKNALPANNYDEYWEKIKRDFIHDMREITKESYGMSTKKAQKLINPNAKTKTSEGCTKYIKVKETVAQWTCNMIDYLKSAMSYTNKRTLEEFKGNVNLMINSSCAILAVNK